MEIVYWSDYACPYCYIGETHMKTALQELSLTDKVKIEMKAFELDPFASKEYTGTTVDRFARKYGLSTEAAAQRIEDISAMGRRAGLDFRYAQTRYTNTRDAHRLTKLAMAEYSPELVDKLSEAFYKAYFTDGLELANHAVLLQIALQVGMDEKRVRAVLESREFEAAVVNDEVASAQENIHGVPYFIIAGKYAVPGAMPVDAMKELLQKVYEQECTPEEIIAATAGSACGPDGCSF